MLFSLCGVVAMTLFWYGTSTWTFYAGAFIFGIYSSAFFFYLVFHSLVHPEKSGKYVAWNEVVVGITGIAAPMVGGYLIDLTETRTCRLSSRQYLIVSVIAVQVLTLRKIDPELLK